MILTCYDHSGHRGEVERGELDKDDHLQQHQQTELSCCLVTKCWAGGGGGKKTQGVFATRQSFLTPGMHSILSAALLKTSHMHDTEQRPSCA